MRGGRGGGVLIIFFRPQVINPTNIDGEINSTAVQNGDVEIITQAAQSVTSSAKKKGRKTKTVAPGAKKRKVGRPKNAVMLDHNQPTLMSMFGQVSDSTQDS